MISDNATISAGISR